MPKSVRTNLTTRIMGLVLSLALLASAFCTQAAEVKTNHKKGSKDSQTQIYNWHQATANSTSLPTLPDADVFTVPDVIPYYIGIIIPQQIVAPREFAESIPVLLLHRMLRTSIVAKAP